MSHEKRSAGSLTTLAGAYPVVPIDCSHWPRGPATARSSGKLVRVGHASFVPSSNLPGPTDQPKPQWLELVVTFAGQIPPADVWQEINRLLLALSAAAPELKLTYDALHSRAENGDLVIALTPAVPMGTSERIGALTDALRIAVGKSVAVRGIRIAA